MPLPRWLHSLIQPKPTTAVAPPPPRGEGWGGGLPQTTPDTATPPDTSHRIHIAASDPAFPAKREAAVALICDAITDIATPLGYTRKGTTWTRTTPMGRTAINLQRSSYGFVAYINLRFLRPDGTPPTTGLWVMDDSIRLQKFYLPPEHSGAEDGVLTYLDVQGDPASLDLPMHILKTRALPWLDAHHTANSPEIEDFLRR